MATMFKICIYVCIAVSLVSAQVQDVCLSMRSEQGSQTVGETTSGSFTQGRPGKKGNAGAMGPPGLKGDVGSPGQCTCESYEELRNEIRRLRMEACTSGILYNGFCIKLHYTRGTGVEYNEAARLCSINNGTLAEITSDRMYDAIFNTIGNFWVEYTDRDVTYVNVWLGSSYAPDLGIVSKSGEKITISSKHWFPRYPKSNPEFVNLLLEWSPSPTARGLFNYMPSYSLGVPLCQYVLPK